MADVDRLMAISANRKGFCSLGYGVLKVAQFCGLVQLSDRALEILPKISPDEEDAKGRLRLIRMLRAAGEASLSEHDLTVHDLSQETLLDVFISRMVTSSLTVIKGGLLTRYREEEGDLRVVRGAIDFSRQVSHFAGRRDVVACKFDELSIDNPWNRAMKLGLAAVRPWIRRSEVFRRWAEVAAYLNDVALVPMSPDEVRRFPRNRLVRRYDDVLRWIILVLSILSPSVRAGRYSAPGLLFNMNYIFQQAIASTLRASPRSVGLSVDDQDTVLSLARVVAADDSHTRVSAHSLRPDLVIRRDGNIAVIADSKWKRLEANSTRHALPNREDVYQMLAYAAAYKCESLALIYPWHSGLQHTIDTCLELPEVGGVQPRLSVVLVDVESRLFTVHRGFFSRSLTDLLPRFNEALAA